MLDGCPRRRNQLPPWVLEILGEIERRREHDSHNKLLENLLLITRRLVKENFGREENG